MREIKFRAWDKEQKKMLNWELLQWNQVGFVHSLIGEGNWRAMQYTGLLDKNGKEIYESDLVRFNDSVGIYRVDWVGAGFWLTLQNFSDVEMHHNNAQLMEVIGNIYENKKG